MTEHGRQASVTQRGSPDSTRRPFITIIKINTLILIIATARAIPMITMIYRNTLASECRQRLGLQHRQTHETALAGSSTGEVEVRTASADRCVWDSNLPGSASAIKPYLQQLDPAQSLCRPLPKP